MSNVIFKKLDLIKKTFINKILSFNAIIRKNRRTKIIYCNDKIYSKKKLIKKECKET